jgi:hypothetical protein
MYDLIQKKERIIEILTKKNTVEFHFRFCVFLSFICVVPEVNCAVEFSFDVLGVTFFFDLFNVFKASKETKFISVVFR